MLSSGTSLEDLEAQGPGKEGQGQESLIRFLAQVLEKGDSE